jgi:hypothetical protein
LQERFVIDVWLRTASCIHPGDSTPWFFFFQVDTSREDTRQRPPQSGFVQARF